MRIYDRAKERNGRGGGGGTERALGRATIFSTGSFIDHGSRKYNDAYKRRIEADEREKTKEVGKGGDGDWQCT